MRTVERWQDIKTNTILPRYFPPRVIKELDEFGDTLPNPPDCDFEEGEGLYLWGEVGAGKTLQAAYIMEQQIKQKYLSPSQYDERDFKFLSAPDLFIQLRRTYGDVEKDKDALTEWEVLEGCLDPWMLVLDDIAPFGKQSDWMLGIFYFLINARIERGRPTIYTSNLDLDGLAGLLDDRITDRIQRSCVVAKKSHWKTGS